MNPHTQIGKEAGRNEIEVLKAQKREDARHDAQGRPRLIASVANIPLGESEIACAVADAWATIRGLAGFPTARAGGDRGPHSPEGHTSYVINRMMDLRDALDRLERATRESPLRKHKVKP